MPAILGYGGRFKLWDRPAVYPQVDLINKTPEGPVFDLDVQTEDGGASYLRVDHVEEMAEMLGWMSPEQVAELRAENEMLKNQVLNLPNAIEELKDGIDSRVADFYDSLNYRPSFPVDNTEEHDENDGQSDSGDGKPDSDSLESFGLSSIERPDGIPSDSSNGTKGKPKSST